MSRRVVRAPGPQAREGSGFVRFWAQVALCAGASVLVGCASPRTTVLLLPDADNKVGAVTLSTPQGTQRLDRAFQGLTEQGTSGPQPVTSARAEVESRYAALLRTEPPSPRLFTLQFQLGKAVLTESSRALLPEILAAVRERAPTEITVFGHADATGGEALNLKLSAVRAQAVADWLHKQDPTLQAIDVQYFGETRPLPDTTPGRPEPANRRAEVMIL